MYSRKSGLVFGFHGTDKAIAKGILNSEDSFHLSDNGYDWLGPGIYFWENSVDRALKFAQEAQVRKPEIILNPSVIGAVLDLGYCLDLLDYKSIPLLKVAYKVVVNDYNYNGRNLPQNKNPLPTLNNSDLLLRYLDCAVIRAATQIAKEGGSPFDSVRSAFWEGDELYPGAGFRKKSHIQIAVLNRNCIKGIFLPREKEYNDYDAW